MPGTVLVYNENLVPSLKYRKRSVVGALQGQAPGIVAHVHGGGGPEGIWEVQGAVLLVVHRH